MRKLETQSVNYIILRHSPFQESGLLLSGISPERGRLDFIVRGAKSQGKKKFPVAGLFREMRIEYRMDHESSFPNLKSMELISCFDGISAHTGHYLSACTLAKFLLDNTRPMLDSSEIYTAFRMLLKRYAEGRELTERAVLLKTAFFSGNGMLPEPDNKNGEELLETLFSASQGMAEPPSFSQDYWEKLDRRFDLLLRQNGFPLLEKTPFRV